MTSQLGRAAAKHPSLDDLLELPAVNNTNKLFPTMALMPMAGSTPLRYGAYIHPASWTTPGLFRITFALPLDL